MKVIKNVMSILVLTIILVGNVINVNAQSKKVTENEVKNELIKGFASFVESVRPFYAKDDSYSQFKRKVLLGTIDQKTALPSIPSAGENMLMLAYQYLSAGYYYDDVITLGDYQTMGEAILYINNQAKSKKSNFNDIQYVIFGDGVLVNNPFDTTRAGCKWWQLSCILDDIFGDTGGGLILDQIISILIKLLN